MSDPTELGELHSAGPIRIPFFGGPLDGQAQDYLAGNMVPLVVAVLGKGESARAVVPPVPYTEWGEKNGGASHYQAERDGPFGWRHRWVEVDDRSLALLFVVDEIREVMGDLPSRQFTSGPLSGQAVSLDPGWTRVVVVRALDGRLAITTDLSPEHHAGGTLLGWYDLSDTVSTWTDAPAPTHGGDLSP